MKKFLFISLICIGLLLCINAKEAEGYSIQKKDIQVPQVQNIDNEIISIIKNAKETALYDGKKAASIIDDIKDDDIYKYTVAEVLDEMYFENSQNSELYDFEDNIRKIGIPISIQYKKALAERKNKDLDYNPHKIIVEFDSSYSTSSMKKLIDFLPGEGELVIDTFRINEDLPIEKQIKIDYSLRQDNNQIAIIDVDKGHTTSSLIEEYRKYEGVVKCWNDYYISVDSETNDTYVDQQWYINSITSFMWYAFNNVLPEQSNTYVAVIDTGLDVYHEDLSGQFLVNNSVDVTNNYTKLVNSNPPMSSEHGTCVAGIINAKTNNGVGIAGLASIEETSSNIGFFNKCKIMALKASVIDNSGQSQLLTSAIINSIYYATFNGADIINMSFGSDTDNGLQTPIDFAYNAGVTCVASAGNDNESSEHYPSDLNHVISVIAIDSNDNKASFSNYGSNTDISAPGVNMYTTSLGDTYVSKNGTSFAAPYVSGVIALMKQADASLTPSQIENIIINTATDIGATGYDQYTANGKINLAAALYQVL